MTEIIIPIKSLTFAKQRLASILTPSERAALVLAMLEDLLATISLLDHGKIWIVASDDAVFDIARKHDACPVCEPKATGYNEAVLLGLEASQARRDVAVLPGDIPLARVSEIAALIAPTSSDKPHIRLAAARDLQGTNGLFLSRKDLVRPAFGANSFSRYRRASQKAGVQPQILEAPGMALDIDIPADLHDLAIRSVGCSIHAFFGMPRGSVSSHLIERGAA
ncbi:2-phospho-L-lactate guanylyltransferase [Hoeflea poritis]|uniref:3-phospho-D-glycerate guanylyltransferase n=1 Tax=Hoeflea poritis TaxID=2993659 RepID=A0ABT4VVM2_9HYPH|nr:2-phospho-L-lactate guanylyltransferase [Hoeflea poritis]MDA4848765.1 2-phospho-L-lactate guanylyltransferase [Hoeflea poritis]